MFGGRAAEADGTELRSIQAGEDGDGKELRRAGGTGKRFTGGGEHGGSAGGVEGEHVDAQPGGRANGAGNGVGDIVELEVEEDAMAATQDGLEDRRARGDKELEANLEPRTGVVQPVEKDGGSAGIRTSRATMRRWRAASRGSRAGLGAGAGVGPAAAMGRGVAGVGILESYGISQNACEGH